jgi:hypothetical protein
LLWIELAGGDSVYYIYYRRFLSTSTPRGYLPTYVFFGRPTAP